MSNYNSLKTTIDANIKQNGRQEITGQILNSVLNQMVTTLGAGYQFAGVATLDPATDPGTPDAKVFYIANGKGTYTNFGGVEVTEDDVVVLYWDSSWHKVSTGIASQEKLTELDQKVGNSAKILSLDSSTFAGLLYYSDEVGFVSATSYNPDFDGWIIELRKGATYSFVGPIVNVVLTKERPYDGYIPNPVQMINQSFVADGVYKYAFFTCHKTEGTTASINVSSSGLVKDVAELQGDVAELQGDVENIKGQQGHPCGINTDFKGELINKILVELYIEGASPSDQFYVEHFQYDDSTKIFGINIAKDGSQVTAFWNLDNSVVKNTILTSEGGQYKIYAFIGDLDGTATFAYTSEHYNLLIDRITNLYYSPHIGTQFLSEIKDDVVKTQLRFIDNETYNEPFVELYIPNAETLSLRLNSIGTSDSGLRAFFIDSSNNLYMAFEGSSGNLNQGFYDAKPILPIVFNNTIYGWCVLKQSIVVGSGLSVGLNYSVVENVNNSPTIKSMLNSKQQIVLIGDSIFGQPHTLLTPAIIMGLTGKRVYNCGFGGCCMAVRTSPAELYDFFTLPYLADAVTTQDFSNQEGAMSDEYIGGHFRFQLNELKSIDWTKETTIICNFSNNDLTNNVALGNSYVSTVPIASLDKTKFNEAQTYAIATILAKYPKVKFIFLGNMFRMFDGTTPLFEYTNPVTKLTAENFISSEQENCKKMGVRFIDSVNMGIRTAFNILATTLDGTHLNNNGSYEMAVWLSRLWKEINS